MDHNDQHHVKWSLQGYTLIENLFPKLHGNFFLERARSRISFFVFNLNTALIHDLSTTLSVYTFRFNPFIYCEPICFCMRLNVATYAKINRLNIVNKIILFSINDGSKILMNIFNVEASSMGKIRKLKTIKINRFTIYSH